uniref:Uncharacterized protein n=1 Tax=Oryza brachyantha TaxID=4533 RepID=J3LQS6_ORYBR
MESLASGSSSVSLDKVALRLQEVPTRHGEELGEVAKMSASQALAITKSLYPRVELNTVTEGLATNYEPDDVLRLVNEAQVAVESIDGVRFHKSQSNPGRRRTREDQNRSQRKTRR